MSNADPATATSLYEFQATTLSGDTHALSQYAGNVALVVNTASKCGFTPQFAGLQKLYDTYRDQGFVVLGFPSAQFKQEFGAAEKTESFCKRNYGVEFPMFATTNVNGRTAHPVFTWLQRAQPGGLGKALGGRLGSAQIKWNFTKFLVGRDGHVIARYAPMVDPAKIVPDIEAALRAEA